MRIEHVLAEALGPSGGAAGRCERASLCRASHKSWPLKEVVAGLA